ncbi:hypothetical protein SLS60_006472 [Paraconiothyrium brasiliense]|uniref:Uncharacterized protein n=1 Tax=Paraconiothyrium brasiliense TaxID=300254 RepID=A0ABR3RCA1_9PLEO
MTATVFTPIRQYPLPLLRHHPLIRPTPDTPSSQSNRTSNPTAWFASNVLPGLISTEVDKQQCANRGHYCGEIVTDWPSAGFEPLCGNGTVKSGGDLRAISCYDLDGATDSTATMLYKIRSDCRSMIYEDPGCGVSSTVYGGAATAGQETAQGQSYKCFKTAGLEAQQIEWKASYGWPTSGEKCIGRGRYAGDITTDTNAPDSIYKSLCTNGTWTGAPTLEGVVCYDLEGPSGPDASLMYGVAKGYRCMLYERSGCRSGGMVRGQGYQTTDDEGGFYAVADGDDGVWGRRFGEETGQVRSYQCFKNEGLAREVDWTRYYGNYTYGGFNDTYGK